MSGGLIRRIAAYRSYIAGVAPDLLITYNWGSIEVALANLLNRLPHIHMEDGFGPEESKRQFPRRIWMRRLALSRSEVVVPSLSLQDIAARVWRLDMGRVNYIPNGVRPRREFQTPLASACPDLPAGLCRIVWAGALRQEKNPLRLLRAFAPLKDKAVLILIGDGPERGAILEEAERRNLGTSLRLLGHRADARDIIMQCEILALSSDTEQMPFAVLEAMDAGLAIASVDVGDVRSMVAPGNRPFIVPVSDGPLSEALRSLVEDGALRRDIGASNRARLGEVYGLQGMVDAYRKLFERVSGARRGAAHVG